MIEDVCKFQMKLTVMFITSRKLGVRVIQVDAVTLGSFEVTCCTRTQVGLETITRICVQFTTGHDEGVLVPHPCLCQ